MGLNSILTSASAGLQAVESQLQWRTDNVNNASNTAYAERTPVTVSTSNDGISTTITRASDAALQTEYLNANSQSSASGVTVDYYTQVGDILGTTQSTSYLQQDMDSFTSSWEAFETDTSDSTSESEVVSTGQTLAEEMNSEAQQLQTLGTQASNTASDQVTTLNSSLTALAKVNQQLSADPNAATDDPNLLDQRDSLVSNISGIVGINVVTHNDGSVALYTKQGTVLVDKTASQYQWNDPTGSGTSGYISLSGQTSSSPGMNAGFSGGTLGATLDFLNPSTTSSDPDVGTLAKAQAQLNSLALQLTGQASGTFGGAYYSATADRTTDLAGGSTTATAIYSSYGSTSTATAAGWNGTALSTFFTIDNGSTTGPTPPTETPAESLAVNSSLVSGTSTVKRESATAVVAALTATTRSMSAGGLTVSGETYSGLAASIASTLSTAASNADTENTSLNSTTSTLNTRLTSELGVNTDTEMAQLTVLENDYSAVAKVITTVQSMFDTLLGIGT
jgi:flagellar hook-associated protein 1 FlgK